MGDVYEREINSFTLIRLLTVDEASQLLNMSKEATWRYVRAHLIPSVRVGRQIRFDEKAILEWIRNGGCGLKERVSKRNYRNN